MPTHRGFYFHFADMHTGERVWESESSSIDTAILLCGVLTCRQYFHDRVIEELALAIFNRVNWTWITEGTALLSMGWTPEFGFIPSRWGDYSELMMMYLLGMGSASYPLTSDTWSAWKRTIFDYDGLRYIGSFAPLFVNQYSQAWFDSGTGATVTRTTLKIRSSPPMRTASFALSCIRCFPTTRTRSGASRHLIPAKDM